MQERYSLGYYRGNNIIEPITEDIVGFSFLTDKLNAQIRELKRLVKEDVYGCYLVSGMKGVGKTSFINIALSNLDDRQRGKENVIVRLNAVRLSDAKELLSLLIKELLLIARDRNSPINAFCANIEIIHAMNEGILKKTVQGQAALELELGKTLSIGKETEIGVDTDRITKPLFKIRSNFKGNHKKQLKANVGSELKGGFEYSLQEKPDQRFRELLNEFEQSGIRLILVLDEIDKCEKSFMEDVFRQYKDLLTNYKLFCFFVTDERVFADSATIKNNGFDTYFIKRFYLPLLSYRETMQYCYKHFNENAISCVDILYYLTLGNTRALNIYYKTQSFANIYRLDEVVLLYKARLFQYIMDNIQYELDEEDVRNLKSDFLKVDIKAFIEYIFDERECSISAAVDYYNRIKTNRYPKAEDILEYMRTYKDKLDLQMMKFLDDKIHICFDKDIHICVAGDHLEINEKNGARV